MTNYRLDLRLLKCVLVCIFWYKLGDNATDQLIILVCLRTASKMADHSRGKHRNETDSWQSLRLFLFYRIGLWAVLLLMFMLELQNNAFGEGFPTLFRTTCILILLINFVLLPVTIYKKLQFRRLVILNGLLDIVGLTILLFSSHNGLSSGVALLMIPTIAAVASLLPGRIAVGFAALSTIAILGLLLFSADENINYSLAGFHGIIYFIVASVALKLARRAEESELALSSRDEDLSNLATMNEEIIDRLNSGIIVVGDDGRVRMINQSAWKIIGDPRLKRPLRLIDLSTDIYTNFSVWKKRKDDRIYHQDAPTEHTQPFESRFVSAGKGKNVATLIFLEDTAEKNKQVQEEKLASLGRLTASIAHEIRNPLSAIHHSAQLMDESEFLTNEHDIRLVDIIKNQSRRINKIIENVLGLSRRAKPVAESINLTTWLPELVKEYRHTELKQGNTINLDTPDKTASPVLFDSDQLRQVLWNLFTNAENHANSTDNVIITVNYDASPDFDFTHIDVIDNGSGIDQSQQRQLFEPFFTTHNNGTGLGLYVSRELCISNGGSLNYVALPDAGSCFRIKLPVA